MHLDVTVALAGVFFVLFFGFFAGQNYVTVLKFRCCCCLFHSLLQSVLGSSRGDLSLGLIYSFLCVAAVFTPAIFDSIKTTLASRHPHSELVAEKYALVLGSFLYAPFFGSCATDMAAFQLVSSAALGIGAAMLWVAQGSMLTACSSPSSRERDAGVFWMGYMGGNAAGNFAAFSIRKHCDVSVLFCMFCAVCVLASVLCALVIRPRAAEPPRTAQSTEQTNLWNHVCADVLALKRALQLRQVARIIPLLAFIGLENSFWAGEFTQLVAEDEIGAVLGTLAVFEVLAGLLMGVGGAAECWVAMGGLSFASALSLVCLEKNHILTSSTIGNTSLIMYAAAGCFGVGDAVFNTTCIAQLGRLSEDQGLFNRRTAFVLFQSVNTLFNALGYFVAPAWPVHGESGTLAQVYVLASLLFVSTILYIVTSRSTLKDSSRFVGEDPTPDLLSSKLVADGDLG